MEIFAFRIPHPAFRIAVMNRTVVLAYSGGLDTSVCVRWLTERGYRVVAFMADVGQMEPLRKLAHRARVAGATEVTVRDLRKEFATDYILPALKAHAVYEGKYFLATALSRPLIAKHLVEAAHRRRAGAVAHGCTGKGNDQVRFEVSIRALDPNLQVIAPLREWEFRSRAEELAYAKRHGIPVDLPAPRLPAPNTVRQAGARQAGVQRKSPYSIDQNLWGVSIEAGPLEDAWQQPPDDSFRWVRSPERTPAKGAVVTVGFEQGVPVALNGRRVGLVQLIEGLNRQGAIHGIGRSDLIESRIVGIKSREVYEAPAAHILMEAHSELERLVLDRELLHFKQAVALKYAELVYYGLWFTQLKASLDAFVDQTQERLTGAIRLRLFKGSCQVVGRHSPHGLYRKDLATYTKEDRFDRSAAAGFIKLWGLPYEGRKK